MTLWSRPEKGLLDAEAERAIVAAIVRAERATSAEIRVHVDASCEGDPLVEARRWFERLGMTRTGGRSGVLVYVAVEDRKLALFGDEGIHERLGADDWASIRDRLVSRFREGRFGPGLEEAIAALGATLARVLPRRADDRNELSDDVSRGGV